MLEGEGFHTGCLVWLPFALKRTVRAAQVMENTVKWMARAPGQQVFRAPLLGHQRAGDHRSNGAAPDSPHSACMTSCGRMRPAHPLKDLQPDPSAHRALGG